MEALRLTAARLALDEQPTEELPAVATDALLRGLDSPSLREAAGVSTSDVREARDLFEAALAELGIEMPDEQGALWLLVCDTLQRVVEGSLQPLAGAQWIWGHAYWRTTLEGDLRVFVGLASEAEDHPAALAEVEVGIREAAAEVLHRGHLRPWLKVQARPGESPVREPGKDRALDLATLPISEELRASLQRWAADFDAVSSAPGPGPSGFPSVPAAEDFVGRGEALMHQLQREVGDGWQVEYMPTPRAFPSSRR